MCVFSLSELFVSFHPMIYSLHLVHAGDARENEACEGEARECELEWQGRLQLIYLQTEIIHPSVYTNTSPQTGG